MYRIETTDPVSGKSLTQLAGLPYVIESDAGDKLVIYFESEDNREQYLQDPSQHKLEHNTHHPC